MTLSIILPSIHKHSLERMLDNIAETTVGKHEVVIVSPFYPPPYPGSTHWVHEGKRLGSSGAQAYGVTFADGHYVVALSDDVILLNKGWDIDVLHNFHRREALKKERGPLCLALRLDAGGVNVMYGKAYPSLPFMRRADVDVVGWYDPIYFSRYGDNDLGLRIWEMGGRVEWTENAIVSVHPDNASNGMTVVEDDRTKFLARWQHKFPDWPNDPSKYDCGIDMERIGGFFGNTANFSSYHEYHEARRLTGHRGYDGTVAADGKVF
jgi:hypothetical protein